MKYIGRPAYQTDRVSIRVSTVIWTTVALLLLAGGMPFFILYVLIMHGVEGLLDGTVMVYKVFREDFVPTVKRNWNYYK